MRKVWTKIGVVVMLCVVMVSFTACSLFTDDYDTRYSTKVMVATAANSDVSVSKKELYFAYLEWGYQYAEQMEQAALLEYMTEYLLNDKILEKLSLERFGPLTDTEIASARQTAFSALDSALQSAVYDTLDMDEPTATADDTTTDSEYLVEYTPYTKSILTTGSGANRSYSLNLDSYRPTTAAPLLSAYEKYTPTFPGIATEKVATRALSRIVRNLQNIEKGFKKLAGGNNWLNLQNNYLAGLTPDEQAVLNRELDRMIVANLRSVAVSRWQTAYDLGLIGLSDAAAKTAWQQGYLGTRYQDFDAWVDSVNAQCGNSIAYSRALYTANFYQEMVRNAINSYDYQKPDEMEKNIMSAGLDNLYYVPHQAAQNLFTVSHILVGFTDEQKTTYQAIKEEAAVNPSFDAQSAYNRLFAATTSNGKTAFQIYNDLKNALRGANSLQNKYQIFQDYIYKYNTDPGMQNPTSEYLMSRTKDNNSMIEEFTDACLELRDAGKKGAISQIVWGEYGAHIIMYTRDVSDFVYTGDADMLPLDYEDSLFATLTAYGNKTRFDALAEYFTRSFTNQRNRILNDYKAAHQISIMQSEFKKFFD